MEYYINVSGCIIISETNGDNYVHKQSLRKTRWETDGVDFEGERFLIDFILSLLSDLLLSSIHRCSFLSQEFATFLSVSQFKLRGFFFNRRSVDYEGFGYFSVWFVLYCGSEEIC